MASDPKRSSSLKKGLSALILLLLLVGGSWALWHYVVAGDGELSASAAAGLTDANVDGAAAPRVERPGQNWRPAQRPQNFGQLAARFAGNFPDGIMPAGNAYLIKAGNYRVNIDAQNGINPRRGDWRYRFFYAATPEVESPQQVDILRAARTAMNDAATAQKLGVTAEQIQQLRTVPGLAGGAGGNAIVIDAAERTTFNTLFHEWLVAAGRSTAATSGPATRLVGPPLSTPQAKAAEQKLLAAVSDIGNRHPRQTTAARAQRVQSILGDELLKKLKPTG